MTDEAKKPIDPTSMLLGWLVGSRIAGQRSKKEEQTPIAYLYNGVRLPDINEVWTDELKKTHPYVLMRTFSETTGLYFSTNPFSCSVIEYRVLTPPNTNRKHYTMPKSSGEIIFITEYEDGADGGSMLQPESLLWANHDIINTDDNTVYLAASEPVPVYE